MGRFVSSYIPPRLDVADHLLLVWRYIFDPEDRIVGYYKNENSA